MRYDRRQIIPDDWSGTAPLQFSCGEVGDWYRMHGDFMNRRFLDAAASMLADGPELENRASDFRRV